MNGNKRWWLSAAGAVAFALSFAAGARGDGAVSDAEAAKLVGGDPCDKAAIPLRCRRLLEVNPNATDCPGDITCFFFIDAEVESYHDNSGTPVVCGNCGNLYNSIPVCFDPH